MLLSGGMFAQDFYWSGFDYHDFMYHMNIIGKAYFDGELQSRPNIEIASFVNGELRGTKMLVEPYPNVLPGEYFVWNACYYTTLGETFTFKAYDHDNSIEYDLCDIELTGQAGTVGTVENPIEMHFTRTVEPTYGPDYPWVPSTNYNGEGMLVIAQIQINGQLVDRDTYEVGAFCGDECRGSSRGRARDREEGTLIDFGDLGYFAMMNIMGIDGDIINFYLYDLESNSIFPGVCNTTVTLQNGGELGIDVYGGDIFVLNFVNEPTFTKDITHYQGDNDHYYLIASPIGEVIASEVNHLRDNNFDFYSFEQSPEIDPETGLGLEWINHREEAEYELQPGIGYLYANSADVTLEFTGNAYENVNGDTKEVELAYTEGAEFAGCNLVGNPFSVPAFLSHDYYRMNEDGYELIVVATDADGLPAMEGCFVFAEEGEENVVFSTTNTNAKRATLALNLSKGSNVIDRAVVRFGEGHRLPKFQINKNNTKVYIPMDNKDYAVVSSEGMGEMPVNFKAAENGNYSLTASSAEVSFSYLHLIDNMTGTDVDLLATPSYSFDARTTDYASRFRLVFATGSSVEDDSFGFINGSGNLCIFGIEGEATLQVIDVTGRILSTETFSGCYEKQLNVAPGVYVLHLINGDNIKSQKMVVKR